MGISTPREENDGPTFSFEKKKDILDVV